MARAATAGRRPASAKLGAIADFIYGSPSRALWMVGVTGTNGKTSCTQWIAQALERCGRRAAVIGTLGNGLVGALAPAPNTTPDAARAPRDARAVPGAAARRPSRWRCRRTASTRAASTARRSTSRCSPTSRATISTITGRWRRTARRRRGCSRGRRSRAAVINADDPFGQRLIDADARSRGSAC